MTADRRETGAPPAFTVSAIGNVDLVACDCGAVRMPVGYWTDLATRFQAGLDAVGQHQHLPAQLGRCLAAPPASPCAASPVAGTGDLSRTVEPASAAGETQDAAGYSVPSDKPPRGGPTQAADAADSLAGSAAFSALVETLVQEAQRTVTARPGALAAARARVEDSCREAVLEGEKRIDKAEGIARQWQHAALHGENVMRRLERERDDARASQVATALKADLARASAEAGAEYLRTELVTERARHQQTTRDLALARENHATAKGERDEARAEVETLRRDVDEHEADARSLDTQLREARAERDRLAAEVEELQGALDGSREALEVSVEGENRLAAALRDLLAFWEAVGVGARLPIRCLDESVPRARPGDPGSHGPGGEAMMCYRDRTYCSAPCHTVGCSRYVSDEVSNAAKRAGLPLAPSDLSDGCERFTPRGAAVPAGDHANDSGNEEGA